MFKKLIPGDDLDHDIRLVWDMIDSLDNCIRFDMNTVRVRGKSKRHRVFYHPNQCSYTVIRIDSEHYSKNKDEIVLHGTALVFNIVSDTVVTMYRFEGESFRSVREQRFLFHLPAEEITLVSEFPKLRYRTFTFAK